jgi:DNA-binding response OmpR family regulator
VNEAAGPEWVVDGAGMRIVLPDGTTVDLSKKKVLFDLLATLCHHGGKASKEQLLEVAWGVRDYHPLRHDNRLKVAVRKLRRLLEDALGDDPIEASEDGYRLRGRVRYIAAPV